MRINHYEHNYYCLTKQLQLFYVLQPQLRLKSCLVNYLCIITYVSSWGFLLATSGSISDN